MRVCSLRYPVCLLRAPYCYLWPVRLCSVLPRKLINSRIFGKKLSKNMGFEFFYNLCKIYFPFQEELG